MEYAILLRKYIQWTPLNDNGWAMCSWHSQLTMILIVNKYMLGLEAKNDPASENTLISRVLQLHICCTFILWEPMLKLLICIQSRSSKQLLTPWDRWYKPSCIETLVPREKIRCALSNLIKKQLILLCLCNTRKSSGNVPRIDHSVGLYIILIHSPLTIYFL